MYKKNESGLFLKENEFEQSSKVGDFESHLPVEKQEASISFSEAKKMATSPHFQNQRAFNQNSSLYGQHLVNITQNTPPPLRGKTLPPLTQMERYLGVGFLEDKKEYSVIHLGRNGDLYGQLCNLIIGSAIAVSATNFLSSTFNTKIEYEGEPDMVERANTKRKELCLASLNSQIFSDLVWLGGFAPQFQWKMNSDAFAELIGVHHNRVCDVQLLAQVADSGQRSDRMSFNRNGTSSGNRLHLHPTKLIYSPTPVRHIQAGHSDIDNGIIDICGTNNKSWDIDFDFAEKRDADPLAYWGTLDGMILRSYPLPFYFSEVALNVLSMESLLARLRSNKIEYGFFLDAVAVLNREKKRDTRSEADRLAGMEHPELIRQRKDKMLFNSIRGAKGAGGILPYTNFIDPKNYNKDLKPIDLLPLPKDDSVEMFESYKQYIEDQAGIIFNITNLSFIGLADRGSRLNSTSDEAMLLQYLAMYTAVGRKLQRPIEQFHDFLMQKILKIDVTARMRRPEMVDEILTFLQSKNKSAPPQEENK